MSDDTRNDDSELGAAVERVKCELRRSGLLAAGSQPRTFQLIDRFAAFVEHGCGVHCLGEVEPQHVEAFVRSSTAQSGVSPSIATMRLRRSTVRLLFRVARRVAVVDADPTLDLSLPPRRSRVPRPLSDAEVEAARSAALHDLSSTRLSSAWALGEASARTAEIPRIRVRDVDLASGRVWIPGSGNTEPRWAVLTQWGITQLTRRLRELGGAVPPDALVAYRGSGNPETRQSLSSQALRETQARAGLSTEPDIGPGSLAAWAGSRVMHETGRIEAVALALGVRSLDRAALIIGWDWCERAAEPDR